jgi:hypothetical protein
LTESRTPILGETLLYKLSEQEAAQINKRRDDALRERARAAESGYVVHTGNRVTTGDLYPLVVTRVWGGGCVNGQVLLDGNDQLWACSVAPGEGERQYTWPEHP